MVLESRQVSMGVAKGSDRERSSLVLDLRMTGLFQTDGIPRISPAGKKALEALVTLNSATFMQWKDKAGQAKTTFHDARKELITFRYVDHLNDGTYQPTDLGREQGRTGSEQGRFDPTRPMVGKRVGNGPYVVEGPSDPPTTDPYAPTDLPWADLS